MIVPFNVPFNIHNSKIKISFYISYIFTIFYTIITNVYTYSIYFYTLVNYSFKKIVSFVTWHRAWPFDCLGFFTRSNHFLRKKVSNRVSLLYIHTLWLFVFKENKWLLMFIVWRWYVQVNSTTWQLIDCFFLFFDGVILK